jgi:hypothetical protein
MSDAVRSVKGGMQIATTAFAGGLREARIKFLTALKAAGNTMSAS